MQWLGAQWQHEQRKESALNHLGFGRKFNECRQAED
jgi:hypothetical protein